MEIRHKTRLNISWYIGLISLIGGWSIFLIWCGGRYINATDFDYLEIIGFFWMVGFFWLSLFALLLLLSYVIINRRNLHLKMLITGLLILMNIPSILFILPLQGQIKNKVFVKITNKSGTDITQLKLHGNLRTWNLPSLNLGSSSVCYYDPPYWNNDARLYQKPDSLQLIITYNTNIDTVGFPTLSMGACAHLTLEENFKIKIQ